MSQVKDTHLADGVRMGKEESEHTGGGSKEHSHAPSLQLLYSHPGQQCAPILHLKTQGGASKTAVQGHLQQVEVPASTLPALGVCVF